MKPEGPSDSASSEPAACTAADATLLAFSQFRTGLYRYLLRRMHSAQNAEDLVQEVYLRLVRAVDLQQVKFPQAYVYRIACNVLSEFQVRERGRETALDSESLLQLAENIADENPLPEEKYEQGVRDVQLTRAIANLPPMQRAVLQLAMRQDLSHAQMAQQLGITVSTVRNHLYKAIDACRHRLSDEQE